MKRSYYFIILYVILVLLIVYFGTEGRKDFVVEAEYTAGILASSSVLIGFWLVYLGRKAGNTRERIIQSYMLQMAIVSFVLLAIAVVSVFFTALDKFPSVVSLALSLGSFLDILLLILYSLSEPIFFSERV